MINNKYKNIFLFFCGLSVFSFLVTYVGEIIITLTRTRGKIQNNRWKEPDEPGGGPAAFQSSIYISHTFPGRISYSLKKIKRGAFKNIYTVHIVLVHRKSFLLHFFSVLFFRLSPWSKSYEQYFVFFFFWALYSVTYNTCMIQIHSILVMYFHTELWGGRGGLSYRAACQRVLFLYYLAWNKLDESDIYMYCTYNIFTRKYNGNLKVFYTTCMSIYLKIKNFKISLTPSLRCLSNIKNTCN